MSFKTYFTRLLMPLCAALVFASCNKSDSDPDRVNYMEARINGALWNPGTVSCILLTNHTYHFRLLSFSATSTGKTITMEANDGSTGNSISTGTRDFSAGTAFFGYSFTGIPYHVVSGNINVTDYDASSLWVTGTFQFVVEDNDSNRVEILNGRFFRLKYTVIDQY